MQDEKQNEKTVVHTFQIEVMYQHLDIFGHVNNASYLTLLEEARWDLIETNGYGVDAIKEKQQGPTILDIKIRFKKEMKYKDKAIIKTFYPKVLSKKIMIISQEIQSLDGAVFCEAEFTFGFFDMVKRKLIEPPVEWIRAVKLNEHNT